jgi:hypothetical protein
MKRLVLLFFLVVTSSLISQEKHQRAKIYFDSYEELKTLSDLGIPVDHGIFYDQGYVLSDFSVTEVHQARSAGFSIDVLIDDVLKDYLEENERILSSRSVQNAVCEDEYPTPDNFTLGSMGGYYTYQEFLDQLDLMVQLYPNLITAPENISTFLTEGEPDDSTSPPIGGNGIKWVKISDNPNTSEENEPETLFTAVHHAREPTSLTQLIFFMWYLLENYESDAEVRSIVDHTELYFIPVVNPDGYLYNEKTNPEGGGFWRKNRKDILGVDVNRNYDYFIDGDPSNNIWGGEGTSSNPNSNIFHGTGPFSEVESQAVKWLCEQHDFVMGVNNHSFGNGIFFPYGYTSSAFTPEHELYEDFLGLLTSRNGYFARKTLGIAGTTNDFMYGTVNTHDRIFSLTPEIGNQFWLPIDEIIPVSKGMMFLNLTVAKMTNRTAIVNDIDPLYIGDQSVVTHHFTLKNLGLTDVTDFNVSINPVSPNIVAVGAPMSFNNLVPLEEIQIELQYTIEDEAIIGDDIVFELVVNNGDFDAINVIEKKFGLPEIPLEDAGNSVTENFSATDWGVTNTTFVSPPSSITDSPNANYLPNEDSSITILEEIDLSEAESASVHFFARWEIETTFDSVQFEISIDNGTNWIAQCGAYTSISALTNEPVYDGIQNEWVFEEIDLSEYLGEQILARFHLVANATINMDGFYFDDLTFNVVGDNLSTEDNSLEEFTFFPNPVTDVLNIQSTQSNYTTTTYTILGQQVSTTESHSGNTQIDYSGFAKGIYFVRINNSSSTRTIKVIIE